MSESAECPGQERLRLFLDESLAADERADIDRHIGGCAACQQQLDGLTESHHAVGSSVSDAESAQLSGLISRLCALSPNADAEQATSSGIRFPGPPDDTAPLGRLGTYRILELIGDGSSGLLYRAVDETLNRDVALKVLRSELAAREESRQRMHREARAVAALKHDNIVTLFEVGETPNFPPYLVMEYIRGESLGERLKREGAVAPREAAEIVSQVARALGEAHRCGLVHRDVKPSNILLDVDNARARVTDFGLVLVDDESSQLTRTGLLAGTPAYMSPEQILDPHGVDARTDVYGLGVVLYQLLTGVLPFAGTVRMTLAAVLHDEPRAPRQLDDLIPRDLETICLTAMSRDAGRRYPTADALADDLQLWLTDRPITARPVGRLEHLWRWARRNRRVATLSGLVLSLLILLAVGSLIASVRLNRAHGRARRAATVATRQRDQALATLNRLVFEVNEQFEDPAVALDVVQKTVLDISLGGLQEIADTAEQAGLTDLSTAAAHSRLGLVLSRLQRYDEARQQLDRAEEILKALGGAGADDWLVVKSVIETRWNRADLAFDCDDLERSRQLLRSAADQGDRARKRWPDSLDTARVSARAWRLLGSDLSYTSDPAAVSAFQSAINLLRELRSRHPENDGLRGDLLESLDDFGFHYYTENEDTPALRVYGELADLAQARLEEAPDDYEAVDYLIGAHHVMGDIHAENGNKVEAIRHLQAAMDLAKQYEEEVIFVVVEEIRALLMQLTQDMPPER